MLKRRFTLRSLPVAVAAISLFASLLPTPSRAEGFHNALSLQGFTGVLNTPNAAVTPEGHLDALYSDQKDGLYPGNLEHEDSYMASVGMFKLLEFGGRFTEAVAERGKRGSMRDLSASAKLRIPFIPEGDYLPQFAVGAQDFAGGVHFLRTGYVVASEELWRLRLSLGYGTGPDRMDGVFAGAELKAFDWLYLLADYDSKYTNVGARVVVPELFGIPVRLQGTVKGTPNREGAGVECGVGFQILLGSQHFSTRPLKEAPAPVAGSPAAAGQSPAAKPAADVVTPGAASPAGVSGTGGDPAGREKSATAAPGEGDAAAAAPSKAELVAALKRLRTRLADEGFQNLSIGTGAGGVLVVQYENERYNHNELDGLGVVAGIVCEEKLPGFTTVRLVVKKKGIRMLQLAVSLDQLRAFLADASRLDSFKDSLAITDEVNEQDKVRYLKEDGVLLGDYNPSWLRPSLVVYPELRTFFGTEYSPFDYLLSLKPDLFLPVWKGAVAEMRWDIPVSWSSGFDDGQPFRDLRKGNRMDRLMLFQAVKLSPTLMANLGAGMVQYHINGTLDELFWSPADSNHRIGVRFAYGKESDTDQRFKSYLGSYRYYYSPLEVYLEGTGGRFWGGDTGFRVDLSRFFGDTAFSIYYKRVTQEDHNSAVQAFGIQFTFPLTPRRDMNPSIVQLKGSNNWSYAQESEIGNVRGKNIVGQSLGIVPEPYYNLTDIFYNRDRLTESYILSHLLRLRDAYLTYVMHQ